jgi:hypothetical protein
MKHSTRPCFSEWLTFRVSVMGTLSFLLFAPVAGPSQTDASGGTKPYLVLKDTASPDGRYAVAWGLPTHPDVWAKVCEFERLHPADVDLNEEDRKQAHELFESVAEVANDVENYLVDVRDGKIIHKLDCPRNPQVPRTLEPEYWSAAGTAPNRHSLEVVWSQTGNLVLVNHTYRWDCLTFCAILVREGKVGSSLDLNNKLGAAVRTFAAKSFPRGYSKNNLNVSFSEVKQLGETKFSAHVEAVFEKEWSSDPILVNFTLLAPKNSTTIKVADIRVRKDTGD